jgi:hypothetical protein
MATNLTPIVFALRDRLTQDAPETFGEKMPNGHSRQLLAASMGFNTNEALNADDEAVVDDFHVIIDKRKLAERIVELGYPTNQLDRVISAVAGASSAKMEFHTDISSLESAIVDFVIEDAVVDGGVLAYEAEKTRVPIGRNDVTVRVDMSSASPLDISDTTVSFPVAVTINYDDDVERQFFGNNDRLDYAGEVVFQRNGPAGLSDPEFVVTETPDADDVAEIRQAHEEDDDFGDDYEDDFGDDSADSDGEETEDN